MLTMVGALLVGIQAANAHECPDEYEPNDPECQETQVYDDWRPNYVPVFDLADRDGEDGEQQRYDAQRWRDECQQQRRVPPAVRLVLRRQQRLFNDDTDGHEDHDTAIRMFR